ncbi:MAG: cyclase family protein [Anaerolineae bacterium]|nr:cyclase family protein [Anaerolineae bacterium]
MKLYDLSQPLNQDCSFWPFYPPFEVKYIKRKSEQGVNAQYIQTSNHMGTHLDAPRHFVTKGKTIDQIPLEWLYGPGVIVDLSDVLDELDVFTPEMIEERVEVRDGDILFIHTGWHRHGEFGEDPDEEKYIHRHPGPHYSICDWLLKKKIHVWGVDMISTDHPMNLPIIFLDADGLGDQPRCAGSARKSSAPTRSTSCSPTLPTSSPTTRSSPRTASMSRTWAAGSARRSCRTGA